jgi:hypothetical protein
VTHAVVLLAAIAVMAAVVVIMRASGSHVLPDRVVRATLTQPAPTPGVQPLHPTAATPRHLSWPSTIVHP